MDNGKTYVQLKLFLGVITLFTTVIGWCLYNYNALEAKVIANSNQSYRIEAQLSQIQTDLQWIKKELSNIR